MTVEQIQSPQEAQQRQKQQQQQQKQRQQEQEQSREQLMSNVPGNQRRLDRRLSTPAHFIRMDHQDPLEASSRHASSPDNEPANLRSNHHIDHTNHLNRLNRHRHSHCEHSCHELNIGSMCHNVDSERGHKSSKSPASSSSSASDSAFSQSRTTLESESSDQSNCFRHSLKTSDRFSSALLKSQSVTDGDLDSSYACAQPASSSLDDVEENDDNSNQFRIIWRNLSYKVPEKRFARLAAKLQRHKEKYWPRKVADTDPITSETFQLPPSSAASNQNSDSSEEPPLKAPVSGKPRKVIFSNLNGCAKSGQITAILGPSGAGKTTFLKCLTNSIVKGVSGSIDITGGPTSSQHLKLCIIPQKDYLFDNLTVMENLVFASRIKNTKANFDHMKNVERVAKLLGLQACLKLKTSKLSGGQCKRVSIAQELLSKPDILILDEPTSGLDSLTCFRTVSVLRDLVNMSRAGLMSPLAIVMTIHQPQIKLFNLFHHVYILSSMGQCVYEGRPEYLIDTVANCCKLLPPPDDLNPASFIIDLASEVYGTEPIERLTRLQRENSDSLCSVSLEGNKSSNNLSHIELIVDSSAHHKSIKCNDQSSKFKLDKSASKLANSPNKIDNELRISDRLKRSNNYERNFWLHTGLLVKRLWTSMWRDPLLTTTRISFHLIIPFVFYIIYSQKSGAANACPHVEREFDFQSMSSEANVQRLKVQHNELILTFENVSLFFILLYSFSMCVLAVTALSFPLNMQILLKETSNGWYTMPRFVMAKTLADLPIELTMPMISVSLAYLLTGQPSSYLCWRMLTITAVMTLCSLISQTQGLLFGAYFMNNVQAAVFVSQASSLPWIMLSGFTTRVSELPTLLQWLSFGSIYRLGIESIVAVRYGFGMCPCDEELVNDTPIKMVGIPDQLRSVMRYYLDMYSESNNQATNSTEDIFERIASTISKANTYGVDIVSCHDVRPFILSAREVDEGTLPTFLSILVVIFVGLKILLFCVVRFRAG